MGLPTHSVFSLRTFCSAFFFSCSASIDSMQVCTNWWLGSLLPWFPICNLLVKQKSLSHVVLLLACGGSNASCIKVIGNYFPVYISTHIHINIYTKPWKFIVFSPMDLWPNCFLFFPLKFVWRSLLCVRYKLMWNKQNTIEPDDLVE